MSVEPSRAADDELGTGRGPPDAGRYLGRWRNTNPDTAGMLELMIEPADTGLSIRIWGAADGERIDWGTRPAEAFACIEENGVETASLLATYDFGFMASELQLRLNKGILPLMSFTVFRDGSGRSSYYTREFFYRVTPGMEGG